MWVQEDECDPATVMERGMRDSRGTLNVKL